MSTADTLARLLFIVPYVAHRDGVPVAELATKLGISRSRLLADLNLLTMVGRPPLTPDHLIDLYVDDDVVYVELDQRLSRPPRLTHEEACALVLGAKLIGQQGGLNEELDEVLEKIITHLNPAEQTFVRAVSQRVAASPDGPQAPELLDELRRAVTASEEVEIEYYSASSDRLKHYALRPLALITHSGVEYLVALDMDANAQEKLFRLDRLGAARRTGRHFEPPQELDLERFRRERLYFGEDSLDTKVRFSAAVARQVAERFPAHQLEWREDGSVIASLSSSSPTWLARWVLPFGPEAEVLAPESQRQLVARIAQEALQAYTREPVTPEGNRI